MSVLSFLGGNFHFLYQTHLKPIRFGSENMLRRGQDRHEERRDAIKEDLKNRGIKKRLWREH